MRLTIKTGPDQKPVLRSIRIEGVNPGCTRAFCKAVWDSHDCMRYVTRWTLDCETGIAEIVMIEVVEIDADRTEQEIRALWSMAAEAPEAKADGQDLETEKPA